MAKVLALFDLVPGWLWALVLAVATVHGQLAELGEARAVAQAAQARLELTSAQLQATKDLAAARGRAEAKEATLKGQFQETIDALTTSRAADAGRIAGLAGRLQQYARPIACHPSGAAAGAGAGAAPAAEVMDTPVPDYLAWLAGYKLTVFGVLARGVQALRAFFA